MKTLLRLTMLALLFGVAASIYSLSSLPTSVSASCTTGWQYCETNGQRTNGGPGDRSGCSVRSYNPWDNPDVAAYVYTCNGVETTCYYVFKCQEGGGDRPPLGE